MSEGRGSRVWLWLLAALLIVAAGLGGAIWVYLTRLPRDERLSRRGRRYLQVGEEETAIRYLREAVKLNPQNLEAQMALASGLATRKSFDEALRILDEAEALGLDKVQEGMPLRARILLSRGRYRLESAGKLYEIGLCDSVLSDEARPAIELLRAHAGASTKPGEGYTRLGEAYTFEADIVLAKRRRILEKRDLARKLQKMDEANRRNVEALRLLAKVRDVLGMARGANEEAIKADAQASQARLAVARQGLATYVPNAELARKVVAPILEYDPGNQEARLMLGMAEKILNNTERALDLLRSVDRESAFAFLAMVQEAEILMDTGRVSEADAVTAEAFDRRPTDRVAAYVRGRCLAMQGEVNAAVPILQNVFRAEEFRWPEARHELAKALMRAGRREQALQALRDTVADAEVSSPASARRRKELRRISYDACVKLAQELTGEDRTDAAEYGRKAFTLFPARTEAYETAKTAFRKARMRGQLDWVVMLHAGTLAYLGKYDEAIAVCKTDRRLLSEKSRADRLIASCLVRKGKYSEAVSAYETLLKGHLRDPVTVQLELARLHQDLGRNDAAEEIYRAILEKDRWNTRAVVSLCALLARMKRTEEAGELLRSAGADEARARQLGVLLMRLYLRERNFEAALDLAKTHVETLPGDPFPLCLAADLMWISGDREGAREHYDRALKLQPDYAHAYRRVLLDLVEGRAGDAVSLAERGVEKLPGVAALQLYLALASQADGDPARAVNILKVELGGPRLRGMRRMSAVLMVGVIRAVTGARPAGAAGTASDGEAAGTAVERSEFLSALAAAGRDVAAKAASAVNLMLALSAAGILNDAQEQAQTLELLLPDQPLPICWNAQIFDRMGFHEEAVEEYRRVIAKYPRFMGGRVFLARSHLNKGENEAAVEALEEIVEEAGNENQRAWALLQLGIVYQRTGRTDLAVESYEAAIQNRRTEVVACNNLAWLLATKKREFDAALPYALRAHEIQPKSAAVADTLGWVYYLKGDADKAVKYLEQARPRLASNPGFRYRLGAAYIRNGQIDKGAAELREALAISDSFDEVSDARRLLSAVQGRE